jgi:hypothetical protein
MNDPITDGSFPGAVKKKHGRSCQNHICPLETWVTPIA